MNPESHKSLPLQFLTQFRTWKQSKGRNFESPYRASREAEQFLQQRKGDSIARHPSFPFSTLTILQRGRNRIGGILQWKSLLFSPFLSAVLFGFGYIYIPVFSGPKVYNLHAFPFLHLLPKLGRTCIRFRHQGQSSKKSPKKNSSSDSLRRRSRRLQHPCVLFCVPFYQCASEILPDWNFSISPDPKHKAEPKRKTNTHKRNIGIPPFLISPSMLCIKFCCFPGDSLPGAEKCNLAKRS